MGAAEALIENRPDEGWAIVWPLMGDDTDFARAVLLRTCSAIRTEQALPTSEQLLADLYIRIETIFPASEDPKHEGAYPVTGRDGIVHFRDSLIAALRTKGTPESCSGIERIIAAFPDKGWLKWSLEEARKATRQATWVSPSVSEVQRLIADSRARIVRTGDDLLDAIQSSLERLQKRLTGTTPMAFQYWDESTSRPKYESRISDAIEPAPGNRTVR